MHHKRENNTLGQDTRKWKQTKGLCSVTMIILHSIPFQGIMLSASQINFDITNSYILLFQCNSTTLLSNDIYKTNGIPQCRERIKIICNLEMIRFNQIEDLRANNIFSSDLLKIVQHIFRYRVLITKLQNKIFLIFSKTK